MTAPFFGPQMNGCSRGRKVAAVTPAAPGAKPITLWSDISVRREGDSICLLVQRDEVEEVELWIATAGALRAACALLEVALGVERASRVEARLRRDWERRQGWLSEGERTDDNVIG